VRRQYVHVGAQVTYLLLDCCEVPCQLSCIRHPVVLVHQALLQLSGCQGDDADVVGKLRHKHSMPGTEVLCVVLMAAVCRADCGTVHVAQDANT
jgi:hypothetical protein